MAGPIRKVCPTDSPRPSVAEIYEALRARYGPQNWWPGETPFEVIVGALLTQNTNWKNVEKAIARLKEADAFSPTALTGVSDEELAELIRPAGYYRLKAGRLRNFLRYLAERYDNSLEAMFSVDLATLREELLAINGIGPETADAILLYAGGKPSFVVDVYTHRIFKRHGWIEFEADYHALQDHFHGQLEREAALYNDYHAQLVQVGKLHCGPKPRCEGCPLAPYLPAPGPIEPDW